MLFPVNQLIEDRDPPLMVKKSSKVRDALALMIEHDYSQLPIVDEKGNLCGIITDQSINKTYYHSGETVSLLDLTVDNCQTNPVTISKEEDLFEALDKLKSVYAIVVVEDDKPVGILTEYDTTHFFRDQTEGLIYVQDVEEMLRHYIEAVFDDEEALVAALVNAFGHSESNPERPAREYEDMSFYNHIGIIVCKKNWEKFEDIFAPKELFSHLMDQVRKSRNQLVHFRGELDKVQRDGLTHAIQWLSSRPKVAQEIEEETEHFVVEESPLVKPKNKYDPLKDWLLGFGSLTRRVVIFISAIEKLLGSELPPSARSHRSWWANQYSTHMQAQAWLEAGWVVDDVDLGAQSVVFRQARSARYQPFFNDLLNQLREHRPGAAQAKGVSLQNYFSFSSGSPGFNFGWVLPRELVLRVELYIDRGEQEENKAAFDRLFEQKAVLEEEIGESLYWDRLDDNKASRISKSFPFLISSPPEDHEEAKQWGLEMMLKFMDAFQPKLRSM